MTSVSKRPTYDDTFSVELLREYLVDLISRGCDKQYDGNINYSEAAEIFITSCERLKEPLLVLSMIDKKTDLLFSSLQQMKEQFGTKGKQHIDNTIREYNDVLESFSNKELTEQNILELMPERYSRNVQSAKSWRFRSELFEWKRQNK